MNAAGRLELLIEMYSKGLLCSCKKNEVVWKKTEEGTYPEAEVAHEKNCDGRVKVMALLECEDENG